MNFKVGSWYAAFDYVRLTAKDSDYGTGHTSVYGKASNACIHESEKAGTVWKPWAWLGYYGETCSDVSYGSGTQGAILQVSGYRAQEVRRLNPPYDGVPRLDVQVTVWLHKDMPHLARWCADESGQAREKAHGGRWKINVRDGYGDGDTCYIGSRKSDIFIRVYDKWRESGLKEEYRYAWRFEIELSGDDAASVWAGAHSSEPGPEACAAWVRWYLAKRGVSLPEAMSGLLATYPGGEARVTDNERRLAWLRNQVRPSIDKMVAQGVSLEQVAEALGMEWHQAQRTYTKLRDKRERERRETKS